MKSKLFFWSAVFALLFGTAWWLVRPGGQSKVEGPAVTVSKANATATSSGQLTPAGAQRPSMAVCSRPTISQGFDAWFERYVALSPSDRAATIGEGEKLALERRGLMLQLIQDDPEKAIECAIPYAQRKQLPARIVALLEEPVSGRGTFTPIHAKPLPDAGEDFVDTTYRVTLGGRNFEAYTYGSRAKQRAGTGRALHGVTLPNERGENLLALSASPFRTVDAEEVSDRKADSKPEAICGVTGKKTPNPIWVDFGGELRAFCQASHVQDLGSLVTQSESLSRSISELGLSSISFAPASGPSLPVGGSSYSQGTRKLLLIPSVFADDPRPTVTQDGLQQIARNNNEFFMEGSYGTVSWLTAVSPLVTLSQTRSFYGEFLGNLLPEAIAGARNLGYTDDYDEIYVIFPNVPAIRFGGRSDGLLHVGAGAITHELGHNFGLGHANYWEVSGRIPGPVQPRNQPPFPIDSGSWVGYDDINAPFMIGLGNTRSPSTEYGHPFDTMGGGGGHFNIYSKTLMDWLPSQFTPLVLQSSTNRIYAYDTSRITDGRQYGMVVPKNHFSHSTFLPHFVQKNYWIAYRSGTSSPWFSNGLEVLWDEFSGVLLLDTTPNTAAGKEDAAVVIGRTFTDPEAQIHITPIAKGGGPDPADRWIDVVTHIGAFTGNTKPLLEFSASAVNLEPGQSATFTATASDPDGDVLAYHWDFGSDRFGLNEPVMTRIFPEVGHYVVRCEVSDMKGGVSRAQVLVTVGIPTMAVMRGRVFDDLGNPLSGVRVHNGSSVGPYSNPGFPENPVLPPPPTNGPPQGYRYGFTDDTGEYIIGNVPSGTYTNNAFAYRYRSTPQFVNPVTVNGGEAGGLDHLATRLQKVSVSREFDCANESTPGSFVFSREGDISTDLQVHFVMGGSAQHEVDYQSVGWAQTNVTITTNGPITTTNIVVTVDSQIGAVTIPAGFESISLPITPIANSIGDGGKDVTLTLILQTNDFRVTSTLTNIVTTNGSVTLTNSVFVHTTNRVRIPGWELLPYPPSNERHWFQTYPTYAIGTAEATIRIGDDDAASPAVVGVLVFDSDAMEARGDSATLMFYRALAPTNQPLVIQYQLSGSAENGIDFASLPGQVTIPAGSDSVIVPVLALRDERVEGRETVQVTVLPGDYVVGPADGAQVYIVDDDLPLISIYPIDSSASKAGSSGTVMVSRTGDLSEPLVVNYLTTGSATGGVDYVILPGSVTIPAGQISANIDIVPLNNPNAIGPKLATILLSDSPAYNVGPLNSATVVIRDPLPVVSVTVMNPAPSEGAVIGVFSVSRTGPTNTSLNVHFVVGGSAVEQADYVPIGTNVVIPAGSSSANITINPVDDAFNEFGVVNRDEDVIIQLLASANYELGSPSGGRLVFANNDGSALPAVGFLLKSSVVREGETAALALRISSNPETNRPATIDYRITAGSAVPNTHYVPLPGPAPGLTGSVTFVHFFPPDPPIESIVNPDQEGSIILLNLATLRDNLPSGTRNVTLTLFNPAGYTTNITYVTNGPAILTNAILVKIPTNAFIGPYSSHTVTIVDIDTNSVSVSTTVGTAYEEGLIPGQFMVERTGDTTRALRVDLAVAGTAASGNDFVPIGTNNSVVIPAGTNRVFVSVFPLDDPQQEETEYVTVSVLQRPGLSVDGSRATILVADNDGTIQFTLAENRVSEGGGTAQIQVQRTGATNRNVLVDYAFSLGSATLGVDYNATNGTIRFAPGEVIQTIPVTIVDDSIVENPETLHITLTGVSGGVPLGGQKETMVSIQDNDTAFDFVSPALAVAENATNAQIAIRRFGVVSNAASVTFSTTNGTASSSDYVGTNVVVSFSAGQATQYVSLRIIDDVLTESNETVNLRLSNPSVGTALGSTNTAVLTIVEDECVVEFTAPSYSVKEYLRQATVNVRRTGGTVNTLTVNYTNVLGTAQTNDLIATSGTLTFRGDRYELLPDGSGTLVFVPGDTNLPINVTIVDDIIGEINETFTLRLSGPVPGSATFGSNTNALVTILDNEGPGNVDYEFEPRIGANQGANGPVRALAFQSEGRILVGGDFTTVAGVLTRRIARLQADGFLDPSFAVGAGADGPVHAVAVQADSRILIAGDFANVDGVSRNRVARLNGDGNLDTSFAQLNGADQTVRAIALQTNGQILIGGDFINAAGQGRRGLARLNANGSIDLSFNPSVFGSVRALAVQSDGRILVGGIFTNIAGANRPFLARLMAGGQLDSSFVADQGPRGSVYSIALQDDGKILVGGAFTNVGGLARPYVARLNTDGTVDASFDTGSAPNGPVNSVGVHSSGKVTIGGSFTTVAGASRNRFARLGSNGALDAAFTPGAGANSNVLAVAVQPNTAVVIGGEFTEVDGIPRNRIARIHGEERSSLIRVEFVQPTFWVPEEGGPGTLTVVRSGNTNAAFTINYATSPGTATSPADYTTIASGTLSFASNEVSKTISVSIAGDSLLEGDETVLVYLFNFPASSDPTGTTNATLVIQDNERMVQLATNAFSASEGGTNAAVYVVRLGGQSGTVSVSYSTADGTAISGQDYSNVVSTLVLEDGETNKAFLIPLIDNYVRQPSRAFTVSIFNPANATLGSPSGATVTIIDDDLPGAIDRSFDPAAGANDTVRALAVQPDGKVVVGGAFTMFNNSNHNYVVRLNADGAVDAGFTPGVGPNGLVGSLAVPSDGRPVLGGGFNLVNSNFYNHVARLRTNGVLDAGFGSDAGYNGSVHVVRTKADGRIVVGGAFALPLRALAQLRQDGSVDTSFNTGAGMNGPVHAVVIQPDGRVIAGGAFTMAGGEARTRVARFHPDGTLDEGFTPVAVTNGIVYALGLQSDGKLVLGGEFVTTASTNVVRLARLNVDGSLDDTFAAGAGANGTVFALSVDSSDHVVLGGSFTTINGTNRSRIARLNSSGGLDLGFDPGSGANGTVFAIAVVSNDDIFIGGDFTMVNGVERNRLARLLGSTGGSAPSITGFSISGNMLTVTVSGEADRTYALESSVDLVTWSEIATCVISNGTCVFSVSYTGATEFFRVRETSP